MALQRVFKTSYIEELSQRINVKEYMQEKFPYDETRCAKLYGIEHPEGLLERLDPTPEGDLQSAVAIYEAYKNLSPLVAQQDNLWVYLTHVDLFDYVKRRWPIDDTWDEEKKKAFIASHWFRNKYFLRTSLAELWWIAHLSYDEVRKNRFELTETLFKCGRDFRTVRFGESELIRHKEAMIGVLEFIFQHPELLDDAFRGRGQYISRYFNIIGGYKHLSSLKHDYFKTELEKIYPKLVSIKSDSEVQNNTINLQ